MKIKRYIAADMRQAIRMVREEQGPEAVILSSRKLAEGTEIVAAVDLDPQLIREMASRSEPARPKALPEREESSRNETDPAKAADQERLIATMRRELASLRSLLEQHLERVSRSVSARPRADDSLEGRLFRLGVGETLQQELRTAVRGVPKAFVWNAALDHLAKRLPVCADDLVDSGGVVALLGPTGVGKTTTVAKLAARFALRHGRRHMALITTDTYRIGAREQLLTFGEILGVPVQAAENRAELIQLLQSHERKKLVLIDNAGLSQRDLRLAVQLADLQAVRATKTYLVVSATTQEMGLDEIFRVFGQAKLTGCILTKLDEAVTLGPLLDRLVSHQLPVAYVSDGQRVPEDLRVARAGSLVARADQLLRPVEEEPGGLFPDVGMEGFVANGTC